MNNNTRMKKKFGGFKLAALLLCAVFLSSCSNNPAKIIESDNKNINTITSDMVTVDSDDYYSDWKNENPNYIELNENTAVIKGAGAEVKGSKITITGAGVYVISGKLDNGQIIVDVQNKGTVKLVLNGMEINCTDNAPIYVKNAGKVIISLQEGTHSIVTDGEKYILANSAADEPSAAIFNKDDLTINGAGKLTVNANYKDGITGKDDLKITGGNININSADDGLVGRNMVLVKEGNITIKAGGDGIKSTNDTDTLKGFIALEGGTFDIAAGADGIQAKTSALITGGKFTISAGGNGIHADSSILIKDGKIDIKKSYEGIESTLITVSGGETHVISKDDGINVGGGKDGSSVNGRPGQNTFQSSGNSKLIINGGYVSVDATGDGLDANGSISMTGGTVVVNGPTSNGNGALDYDSGFEMTGGLIIAAGSAGMAQAPSEQSKQYSISMNYPNMQQAGTIVHLEDSKGNTVATFAPKKDYQSVVICSPELKKDTEYALYSGGTSNGSLSDGLYTNGVYQGGTKVVSFTISSIVTWLSETGITSGKNSNPGGPKSPGAGGNQGGPKVRP